MCFTIPSTSPPIRARLGGPITHAWRAAADLAREVEAFWKITLPLLKWRHVLSGRLAFIISSDVSSSLFDRRHRRKPACRCTSFKFHRGGLIEDQMRFPPDHLQLNFPSHDGTTSIAGSLPPRKSRESPGSVKPTRTPLTLCRTDYSPGQAGSSAPRHPPLRQLVGYYPRVKKFRRTPD